jgi:predicted amidophosphoribosyltransferase
MAARSLLDALFALIFPDRCAGCAHLGSLFCSNCRAALVPYPGELRRMPASLADMRIAYVFQSPLREAVHQLKYRRVQRMAQPLGALMAEHLSSRPPAIDAVLAIPLHATRLAERGFNQAEALAREVARALGLPLINDLMVAKLLSWRSRDVQRPVRTKHWRSSIHSLSLTHQSDQAIDRLHAFLLA